MSACIFHWSLVPPTGEKGGENNGFCKLLKLKPNIYYSPGM